MQILLQPALPLAEGSPRAGKVSFVTTVFRDARKDMRPFLLFKLKKNNQKLRNKQ